MKKIIFISFPVIIIAMILSVICCVYFSNIIETQISANMDGLLAKAYETKGIYSEDCKTGNIEIDEKFFKRLSYSKASEDDYLVPESVAYKERINTRTSVKTNVFINKAKATYKYSYCIESVETGESLYGSLDVPVEVEFVYKDKKWVVTGVYEAP